MGEVDFNPVINLLRSRILAWNLQISKLHGRQVSSRYLQRAIVVADLPAGSFDLSLSGAILAQKTNFKEYQAAKKLHISSRVSWLRSLARACSQDKGKSEDQYINSLISIEKQRRQSRNVNRTTHKLKSFGTSRIIAPDSTVEWMEQTSKDKIEAGCTWENSRCFSQTSETPFMTSPLVEDFGYLAQGPATAAVLDGSYVPPQEPMSSFRNFSES